MLYYPNQKVAERVTGHSQQHSTTLPKHMIDYHGWVDEKHARRLHDIRTSKASVTSSWHAPSGRSAFTRLAFTLGTRLSSGLNVTGLESLEECVKWRTRLSNATASPTSRSSKAMHLKRNSKLTLAVLNSPPCVVDDTDMYESLAKLEPKETYDLVFIDAQKSDYPSLGGLVVDNVLRRGFVADDSDNPRASQERKNKSELNAAVMGIERLESFLMPLYDGTRMELARLVD
ncbi:hypothetical protein TOPH_04542 [Tolypocladium ophioglossoides CBS 100239]|uniref:Uncharacterized protein n=1 Tax=Tolypocladium ophioglossoides (strain CBS 100239) TaxID=1163406 RepID=A0A0L0NAM3_TOLOC|nr:hypothetical protein TOPH_04542 [Tolypocladium ophioglossoides CBS 100239]